MIFNKKALTLLREDLGDVMLELYSQEILIKKICKRLKRLEKKDD